LADGKIKCIKDEIPFEVPKGWEWCRLKDIGNIITGNTPSKSNSNYYSNGQYPFFKPTDLGAGINVIHSNDTLSGEGYKQSRQLPANSILITCIGSTIGKTGLIRKVGACNQQINAIIPSKFVLSKYIYYFSISPFFQNTIKSNASSTTLPILNKLCFERLPFILPPLEKQKRIVSKIESIFNQLEFFED
jgi:type I restriction enzyme S subunit